jgi:hypothetical protein
MIARGGASAAIMREWTMTFADLCRFLGVLIAFAALVVRVTEAARK